VVQHHNGVTHVLARHLEPLRVAALQTAASHDFS